jgi:thermitase
LGNYQPIEFFYVVWFIRDAIIILSLLFIWRIFLHIKILAVLFYLLCIGIVVLQFINPFNISKEFTYNKSAEILFDIKSSDNVDEIENLLKSYSPEIQQAFPEVKDKSDTELDDYYTLNVDDKYKNDLSTIISELNSSGYTDWVETNDVIKLEPVQSSTTLSNSIPGTYNLSDTYTKNQWALSKWEINDLITFLTDNKPKRKAKIFILDTGIDSKHEDLDDNYVSADKKYDSDIHGHGTHCAGIACAISNNKIGVASLNLTNDFTSITAVKVLDDSGSGTQEGVIDGIIYAADNGADVISMSLGGYATDSREQAYNAAIKYATDKGAIVVVAAGNEYGNAKEHTPACCEGVITISAVDNSLSKAAFSNSVQDIKMKLAAPGVDIYSTFPEDTYKSLNGTSMATPYVAGLIGLMKSYNPDLTNTEAYNILVSSGIETTNTIQTGKFIQPLAALKSMEIKSGKTGFLRKIFVFKP